MFENETQMTYDLQYRFNIAHSFRMMLLFEIAFTVIGEALGAIYFLSDRSYAITLWAVFGLLVILFPFISRNILKARLKKLPQRSPMHDYNVIERYIFDENAVGITSKRFEETFAGATFHYGQFIKIVESKNLLFMYTAPNMAYIIDGCKMITGEFEGLKAFLKAKVGAKYKTR